MCKKWNIFFFKLKDRRADDGKICAVENQRKHAPLAKGALAHDLESNTLVGDVIQAQAHAAVRAATKHM